jgi:ubiquinone/menaquinone biosynthesis C-methylase UbiE
MGARQKGFVPAAGHDWLLPLYDPLHKLLGGDAARQQLVDQAALGSGERVLDIGCGTGSLVVQLKQLHPRIDVVGLDPDPRALARARRKAERAGVSVRLDQGFSDELAYPEASFDRVFSSFMFHHLNAVQKLATLLEARRVLAPGGSLHLLDFGGPEARRDGMLGRWLHAHDHLKDNFGDRIPLLMRDAGFAGPQEVAHRRAYFGRLAYYRASAIDAA